MAGTSIKIETTGFVPVIRFLGRLSTPHMDLLVEMAGAELKKVSGEAFEKQADPVTGKKWEKSKSAQGTGRNTLRDTGTLAGSIAYRIDGDGAAVGSHLVYARIHQEGGQAGRGKKVKLPQRRYLGHDANWPRRFMDMPEVRGMFE